MLRQASVQPLRGCSSSDREFIADVAGVTEESDGVVRVGSDLRDLDLDEARTKIEAFGQGGVRWNVPQKHSSTVGDALWRVRGVPGNVGRRPDGPDSARGRRKDVRHPDVEGAARHGHNGHGLDGESEHGDESGDEEEHGRRS